MEKIHSIVTGGAALKSGCVPVTFSGSVVDCVIRERGSKK